MRVVEYTDAKAYQDRVLPLLLRHECENCVLIGIIGRLVEGKPATKTDKPTVPLLLAIENDEGRVAAAALQTPPHALLITPVDDAAACAIARDLSGRSWTGEEFVAVVPCARMLAEHWRKITGRDYVRRRALRVFRLDCVIDPPVAPGALRPVNMDELHRVADWSAAFARDIGEPLEDAVPPTRRAIEEGRLHVWIENTEPRAMCAWSGPTPNGIRINQVYTPPQFRGRGYASNATAELSRRLLASGRKFCFLFTDADNPTSNSIYQKIGYRQVADLEHLTCDRAVS